MLALTETSGACWPTSTLGWKKCATCAGNLEPFFLKKSSSTYLSQSWSTFPSTTKTWPPTWEPLELISLLTWLLQSLYTWRLEWGRIMGRWKLQMERSFCWRLAVNTTCPGLPWNHWWSWDAKQIVPQAPLRAAHHAGRSGARYFMIQCKMTKTCLTKL